MENKPDQVCQVSRKEFLKKSLNLAKAFIGVSFVGFPTLTPPHFKEHEKSQRADILSRIDKAKNGLLVFDRVGAHWMHPDRLLYNKPSCDIELLYAKGAPPGFDLEGVQKRIKVISAKKDVDIWLRLDWKPGQTLPPTKNITELLEYAAFAHNIAKDNIIGQVTGIICGNEPNHKNEWKDSMVPLDPSWVARCVYNETYQSIKKANPDMLVVVPAIGPFAPSLSGSKRYEPPDGRAQLSPWELYQYELADYCIHNNFNVPPDQIIFSAHIYSRVGVDGTLNGGKDEPFLDAREAQFGALFGTRCLEDIEYAITSTGGGFLPPVVISEWNCFTDESPKESYPKGLLKNVAHYLSEKSNILGLANFVDQDYSGDWTNTAMAYNKSFYRKTEVEEEDGEKRVIETYEEIKHKRLDDWNEDFDSLLKNGL